MSSVNEHFTFQYLQPAEYRFSHDSVFLARRVFEDLRETGSSPLRIADLCSGCGIIGLDLMFHLRQNNLKLPLSADFIEVQEIYAEYFSKNSEKLKTPDLQLNFIALNYARIRDEPKFREKYDLLVCNPPYFRLGHGALSPSDFKNRCRFFIDSDLENLLWAIEYSLQPGGVAYVLLKSLDTHGISVENEISKLIPKLMLRKLEPVRGTDLYRFTKSDSANSVKL